MLASAAAERGTSEAVRLIPGSAVDWRYLANVHRPRGAATASAYRSTSELGPRDPEYAVERLADARLRRGDFLAADQMLRTREQTAPRARVGRSPGLLITSLRVQERRPEDRTGSCGVSELPCHWRADAAPAAVVTRRSK
jgi:hypothetical protein